LQCPTQLTRAAKISPWSILVVNLLFTDILDFSGEQEGKKKEQTLATPFLSFSIRPSINKEKEHNIRFAFGRFPVNISD
jgi:hypothetical protein